jgi:hypothetical protein
MLVAGDWLIFFANRTRGEVIRNKLYRYLMPLHFYWFLLARSWRPTWRRLFCLHHQWSVWWMSESKLCYDWRSVMISSLVWGSWPDFTLYLESCFSCSLSSLKKRQVCTLSKVVVNYAGSQYLKLHIYMSYVCILSVVVKCLSYCQTRMQIIYTLNVILPAFSLYMYATYTGPLCVQNLQSSSYLIDVKTSLKLFQYRPRQS